MHGTDVSDIERKCHVDVVRMASFPALKRNIMAITNVNTIVDRDERTRTNNKMQSTKQIYKGNKHSKCKHNKIIDLHMTMHIKVFACMNGICIKHTWKGLATASNIKQISIKHT